jgi:hypothetical protein
MRRSIAAPPFWFEEGTLTPMAAATLQQTLPFFRAEPDRLRQLHELCTSETGPSLRLLYYAATNYVKANPLVAVVTSSGKSTRLVSIATEYARTLKLFRRRLFDAFRRGPFKAYYRCDGATYETTVGQLVFFKWAHTHGLDALVRRHEDAIRQHEAEVKVAAAAAKEGSEIKANGKRKRLSHVVAPSRRQKAVFGVASKSLVVSTDTDAEVAATAQANAAKRRRTAEDLSGGSNDDAPTSVATASPVDRRGSGVAASPL